MKPLTSLPPHMRSEAQSFNSTTKSSNLTDTKGKVPANQQLSTGLKTPVTTPIHPPPQPQSNHRVSFSIPEPPPPAPEVSNHPAHVVPAKEVEDDDSFGFNSDDDAFLALADLGPPIGNDADIGRPIEADGDRPIDQEEGLLRRPDEDDNDDVTPANPGQNSNTKPTPPSRSDPNATKSRREHIAAALGGSEGTSNITNNTNPLPPPKPAAAAPGPAAGMLSKLLPPHGRPIAVASGSSSGAMRPPPPPQNPNPNPHPSLAQQNHQRYLNQRAQNQNLNSVQQNKSVAPGDAAKRLPTPSIGGFNFPPGVVRPLWIVQSSYRLTFSVWAGSSTDRG
jgi:DNA repair and recombination protein RAD52